MLPATPRRLGTLAALACTGMVLAACSATGTTPPAASTAPGGSSNTAAPTPSTTSAPAAQVRVGERHTALGTVLTTAAGLTLYDYGLDHGAQSACSGSCATAWPPLLVADHARLSSRVALPHRLTTIARSDGERQAAYDGHPLYLFSADTSPGQTRGQGIKGLWFAAGLNGPLMPAPASPTGPMAGSPSMPWPSPPAPTRRPTMSQSQPNPIPQGGGGDHDGDNSGGPSDGDGNR